MKKTKPGSFKIEEVTSNETITNEEIVLVDSSSGDITLTLPNAVGRGSESPKTLTIKKKAKVNTVTLKTINGQTIDDRTTVVLTNLSSIILVSDDINWYII